MPSMDWEDFQHDHHRPHLLVVSMEANEPKQALVKADLDRLIVGLRAIGNYAVRTEGAIIYIAFENDTDANRLAAVLRAAPTTSDSGWASKSFARIDAATSRRITDHSQRSVGRRS